MNNFKKRTIKGDVLVDELKLRFKQNSINYIETGVENFKNYNSKTNKLLRCNNDLTSNFIRFFPDITVIMNQTYLIEVKYSTGIEKLAYENLINLENNGYNIFIYKQDSCFYKPSKIVFKEMQEYDSVSKLNIPVDEKFWRNPQKLNNNDYLKYINAYSNKSTSGNIFAFFNYDKMKNNAITFEEFIINDKKLKYYNNVDLYVNKVNNVNIYNQLKLSL